MLVSDSITRIRRVIRDTNSTVFSNDAIIRVWNETYKRFCAETGILQTYTVLPIPPFTLMTFTHRWEEDFSGSPSNVLHNFISPFTYTQPWEPAVVLSLDDQPSGGFTSTQGWESFYVTIQNRIPHYFPDDFIEGLFAAYDEKPIEWIFRKEIEEDNTAFKTREGVYPSMYIENAESRIFYLYPKVTETYGGTDMSSDYGVLVYDSEGTLNPTSTNFGLLTFATNEDIDNDFGILTYYQPEASNLYLIYKREPLTIDSLSQTIEVPKWCVKYIEFEVMARLLEMETDLFDLELSKHFRDMYKMGLEKVSKFLSRTKTLRTYKLASDVGWKRQQRRLADLPSHYPSYWR